MMRHFQYKYLDGTIGNVYAEGWRKEYNERLTREFVFYVDVEHDDDGNFVKGRAICHLPAWMLDEREPISEVK